MKFISHRGNLRGCEPERENSPDYIDEAIEQGFDVEVDVWKIDESYFLGHDEPSYEIELIWLLNRFNNLWCHAKNFDVFHDLIKYPKLNMFWHQEDDYTITTHNFIWTYPNKKIEKSCEQQIILLFDWSLNEINIPQGGICSDEIILYENKFKL